MNSSVLVGATVMSMIGASICACDSRPHSMPRDTTHKPPLHSFEYAVGVDSFGWPVLRTSSVELPPVKGYDSVIGTMHPSFTLQDFSRWMPYLKSSVITGFWTPTAADIREAEIHVDSCLRDAARVRYAAEHGQSRWHRVRWAYAGLDTMGLWPEMSIQDRRNEHLMYIDDYRRAKNVSRVYFGVLIEGERQLVCRTRLENHQSKLPSQDEHGSGYWLRYKTTTKSIVGLITY